jgi:hypothetical protein
MYSGVTERRNKGTAIGHVHCRTGVNLTEEVQRQSLLMYAMSYDNFINDISMILRTQPFVSWFN